MNRAERLTVSCILFATAGAYAATDSPRIALTVLCFMPATATISALAIYLESAERAAVGGQRRPGDRSIRSVARRFGTKLDAFMGVWTEEVKVQVPVRRDATGGGSP